MPPARHVLIVDDHAELRTMVARLVAQQYPAATIAEAENGVAALSSVAQQPPDLIVTDYQMPVMSGLELVRMLRVQGATMPILVLSSDTSLVEAIRASGATAFLPKPFRINALRELLHMLLPADEETQAVGG
ncbi:MAG: response regulator [Chloroflexota bacterium]|nr:response regulator [Chloroflexota bacterium]